MFVHPFLEGVWRVYETPPPEDTPPSPEDASAQSGGSGQSTEFLSRDEWEQFRTSISEQVAGIGETVASGFGGINEWIAKQTSNPESGGEPDSQSEPVQEEPTEIVVEDRQVVRNQRPRTRLSFGTIARRLLQ
jgi:hypothetical protein